MSFYSVALFLHIVGVLGLFVTLGLEWASLVYLRRATTAEQAREWLSVFGLLRRMGPTSLVTTLLPGLYMAATVWGWVAWIGVALAAMLLLPVFGARNGSRMAAIGQTAATESGLLSPTIRQRLRDPFLWTSVQLRATILLGIVFLMTVKPDLIGSLLTIGAAVILGLVSVLPAWGRVRLQEIREEN
jgi:hypothetical protein